MHSARAFLCHLLLLVSAAHALQPPELTVLRQQHEKAYAEYVTAPFEVNKGILDGKYAAGLERAISDAKAAGKLQDIIAIEAEKKRLADKLPVPAADDDAEPEALKKFRAIYREQLAKLEAKREKDREALLTPYTAKLAALEGVLVKNDRVDEAKEVLTYRQSLAAQGAPPSPMSGAGGPASPDKPQGETAQGTGRATPPAATKVRGDDRKAAEWILTNWNDFRLTVDDKFIARKEDLPKGRFSITLIAIDGRFFNNGQPTAADFQVLAGLSGLRTLHMGGFELKDADLAFIASLSGLTTLRLAKLPVTDAFLTHLSGLKNLTRLEFGECPDITGATIGEQVPLPHLTHVTFSKCPVADATISGIAKSPRIEVLSLNDTPITDAVLPALRSMNPRTLLISSTKITPEGLAAVPMPAVETLGANELSGRPMREIAPLIAPAFPNVTHFQIAYDFETAADIAALAHFKKLRVAACSGNVGGAAWSGMAELRDLGSLVYEYPVTPLPDDVLPILARLKKFKRLTITKGPPSAAALAAFKKQRPDVKVED